MIVKKDVSKINFYRVFIKSVLSMITIVAFTSAHAIENKFRADPFSVQKVITDTLPIAAGLFIMGSNKVDKSAATAEFGLSKPWFLDEHPQHRVTLPAFLIDKFEVTNNQYRLFVLSSSGTPPPSWMNSGYMLALQQQDILNNESLETMRRLGTEIFHFDVNISSLDKNQLIDLIINRLNDLARLPVISVTWQEATEYCQWNKQRLPTEQEWERVARGQNGRQFPWGNEWTPGIGHTGESAAYEKEAPVGVFKNDVTAEGIHDIAGNVSEWVSNEYQAYPDSDHQSDDFGKTSKVVRGSSWSDGATHYNLKHFQRGAYRFYLEPDGRYDDVGFRCVSNIVSKNI